MEKRKITSMIGAALLGLTLSLLPTAGLAGDGHKHDHGDKKHSSHGSSKKGTTITGEVVDLSCYLGHGAKGKKHRKCAATCILGGLPMGILTSEGDVYLVLEDHSKKKAYKKLMRMAAKTVKVTGKVMDKGGIKAITLKKVSKAKT